MSNLTDFFGKGAQRVPGKAAHAQPAFVVVSSEGTSYMNFILYDHALRSMGTVAVLHATGASEFNASAGAWNYSTNPGTNSAQANTHSIGKNGYIGSPLGYGSAENFPGNNTRSMPAREVHMTYQNLPGAMNGTNPGLKQDYALGTSDTLGVGGAAWIRSCPRSSRSVIKGHLDILDSGQSAELIHDTVYPQAVGMLTSGYRLAAGGFSYNQNSGNAIIIERDNSSTGTQWRPVLIKNFPDPRKYVSDQKAWGAAITAITAVSANRVVGGLNNNVTSRDATGYHYAKPILCDNNDVIMMTSRSQGVDVHRWRWNSGNNTWDAATQINKTHSTKYHSQQTAAFPNWCMSLDGKTAVLMSHLYYHACGYALVLIDVATGNARTYCASDASQSFSIVPFGASKFLLSSSTNSDGQGLYASTISWAEGAVDNAYDSLSFGTEMTTFRRLAIDNGYSSTSYPTITPIITVDNESIVLAEKGEL